MSLPRPIPGRDWPTMRNLRVPVFALSIATGLAACGSDRSTSPSPHALDGPWSTHLSGVGLVLDLEWSADSVKGTGTYTVIGNTLGCGGSTLTGNGSLTLAAARTSASSIRGTMRFDNGWAPPYDGMLVESSRID